MTLASDNPTNQSAGHESNRSGSHVSGRRQSQETTRSRNEAVPPTLLRLPDLDPPQPEAATDEVEPQDTVLKDAGKAFKASDGVAMSSPDSVPPIPHDSLLSSLDSSVQAAVATRPKAAESPADPVRRSDSNSSGEGRTLDENHDSEASSWLSVFASRKTLLILLALIAGLAIFMPRGENATSELETPMLVENEPPSQATLATPVAGLPQDDSFAFANTSMDKGASVDLGTWEPIDGPFESFGKLPDPQSLDTATNDFAGAQTLESRSQLASQSEATLDSVANGVPSDSKSLAEQVRLKVAERFESNYGTAASTQVNQTPTSVPSGIEAPITQAESSLDATDEEPVARLVNSSTPQGILDWKKFLPDLSNANSPAPPTSAVAGAPASSGMSPESFNIRNSSAPVAPNLEFALPEGVQPGITQPGAVPVSVNQGLQNSSFQGPGYENSAPQVNSPTSSMPVSAPEARVAMPQASSLR